MGSVLASSVLFVVTMWVSGGSLRGALPGGAAMGMLSHRPALKRRPVRLPGEFLVGGVELA
ncbi:hypothetical protein GCM10009827_096660 [Dactylosporangium maewongense]|uniref:Uncharacterized protein n=1 Tax=Dactylosporangium maewongense TaxID=634393 RepID=A0ABP4NDR0_9ACTN